MTNKEMAEIFSVMLLAWPSAEVFKGGIAKLGPTIKLWTSCTADVDFWTGQQAVIRLCKTNKFPPTIAEFLEQVKGVREKIKELTNTSFYSIRSAEALYGSLTAYYDKLPEGCLERRAIDLMGGVDALTLSHEHNGKTVYQWNYDSFARACEELIRGMPTLVGGKPLALPAKKRQEET